MMCPCGHESMCLILELAVRSMADTVREIYGLARLKILPIN